MPEIPRELRAVGGAKSDFPVEWNKVANNFKTLEAIGVYDLVAGLPNLRLAMFRLTEPLYAFMDGGKAVGRMIRRIDDEGDDEDWELTNETNPVEFDIYPDFLRGYLFAGDLVTAWSRGSRFWYAMGSGHISLRATLTEDLSGGGTATATVDDIPGYGSEDPPTVEVTDYFLEEDKHVVNGAEIDIEWDSGRFEWKFAGSKCSDISG